MRGRTVVFGFAVAPLFAGCSSGDKAGAPAGGAEVVQIAAGMDNTCALTKAGNVYCWGDDKRKVQSRSLSALVPPSRVRPAKVAGITGATFIDLAPEYGCAVLAGGAVGCFWDDGLKPLALGKIEGAVRVSLAKLHGVVEKRDGTALNFVRPDKGDPEPQPLVGIAAAKRVMTGEVHGCALVEGGAVRCWGAPDNGAVGDAVRQGNAPGPLPSLKDIVDLSVGAEFNCAVDRGGAVWCWGVNAFGQTGQKGVGFNGPPVSTPTRVPFVSHAKSVDAGVDHACAVLEGGGVTCWGHDEYGQSGHAKDGAPIAGLKDVVQVAAGEFHTCALEKAGTVKCWGRGLRGQLGNGDTRDSAVPVDVVLPH